MALSKRAGSWLGWAVVGLSVRGQVVVGGEEEDEKMRGSEEERILRGG